jgi:hypothetical protein
MAELPVKARGVRSCSSPTSTLPSRLSSGSSDGEEEVCWICLSHRGGLEVDPPGSCSGRRHQTAETALTCATQPASPFELMGTGLACQQTRARHASA